MEVIYYQFHIIWKYAAATSMEKNFYAPPACYHCESMHYSVPHSFPPPPSNCMFYQLLRIQHSCSSTQPFSFFLFFNFLHCFIIFCPSTLNKVDAGSQLVYLLAEDLLYFIHWSTPPFLAHGQEYRCQKYATLDSFEKVGKIGVTPTTS